MALICCESEEVRLSELNHAKTELHFEAEKNKHCNLNNYSIKSMKLSCDEWKIPKILNISNYSLLFIK